MKKEQSFRKDLGALEEIFDFLEQFIPEAHLAEHLALRMQVAVEELFINAVKYTPQDDRTVKLRLEKTVECLTVSLQESGVMRFDSTRREEYDIREKLENRPGLHLVKQLGDRTHYHFAYGKSRIQLIFLTKNDHV